MIYAVKQTIKNSLTNRFMFLTTNGANFTIAKDFNR